jgi:hypothetical protein
MICRHARDVVEWIAIVLTVTIIVVGALLTCLVSPLIFVLSNRAERRDRQARVNYD